MSGKNQFPFTVNYQSTDPSTGFLPVPGDKGSAASGNPNGVMTGTNTIYSQIFEVSRMDNIGIEFNWTGTPTGAWFVFASNSGKHFYDLQITFPNPAGSAGGLLLNLNQFPFKYFYIKYVNASGVGVATAYCQAKDLN